jgi:hypothetical protein
MPRSPMFSDLTSEPEVSRRQVLRGGATGFVLAATGLLVPEAVEEVAAERPIDGVTGRGDARHRRRKHRHDPGSDRKNDHEAGETFTKKMEFVFIAGTKLTHQIEVWEGFAGSRVYRRTWTERSLSPGQQETFSGRLPRLVLVNFVPGVDSAPVFFWADNPAVGTPLLQIGKGSWFEFGPVNFGGHYVSQRMKENGPPVVVGGFQVKRVGDSPNYKVFFITALD